MNTEDVIKRFIENEDNAGNFIYLDDGYLYWDAGNGALSSWALRALADELDKRNEAWDKQLNEHFQNYEK
jgi:hypothetical protein